MSNNPLRHCLTRASTATLVPYVRPAQQNEDHPLFVKYDDMLSVSFRGLRAGWRIYLGLMVDWPTGVEAGGTAWLLAFCPAWTSVVWAGAASFVPLPKFILIITLSNPTLLRLFGSSASEAIIDTVKLILKQCSKQAQRQVPTRLALALLHSSKHVTIEN